MRKSTKLAIQGTLIAARTAIDAALHMLEDDAEEEKLPCAHGRKRSLTTMGQPERWRCRDCGFEYVEPTAPLVADGAVTVPASPFKFNQGTGVALPLTDSAGQTTTGPLLTSRED